jgi:circadian clock protein KaiC
MIEHGVLGEHLISDVDISYLADTVVLLRFFEHAGEMHRAISVLKRRRGPHERTLREYRIGPTGIGVGPPLTDFQGVLTGNPRFLGLSKELAAGGHGR